jgi:hypothetical protein
MPDCRYCGRFCETDEDLARHLAEAHDEDELSRIDERVAREQTSESSSRLSRRAFTGLAAATLGTGAIAATQASSVGIDGGLLSDDNGPSSTSSHQLVASYPFDGDLNDASGNSFGGGFVNGGGFAEGVFGQAIELNGSNEYVSVSVSGNELAPSGEEWTMSAWVYSEGPTVDGDQILRRDDDGAGGFLYNFRVNPDRTLRLEWDRSVGSGSNTKVNFNTSETIPLLDWAHVAAVIDSSGATLYIDGEPKKTETDGGGDFNPISGGDFAIGAWPAENKEYFNGRIDRARLYDRALSDSEIKLLTTIPGTAVQVDGDNATFDNTTISPIDN